MILQLLNGIQRYQYGVSKPHDRISVLVYSSLIFMVYLVSQNEVETANGLGFRREHDGRAGGLCFFFVRWHGTWYFELQVVQAGPCHWTLSPQ